MDEEDRALFRRAMRGVRPMAYEGAPVVYRRPPPRALFTRAERAAVFRRLRAGHYRVDGEIDLHGLTAADAGPALQQFIAEALRHRARVVRVVHGKGLRSGNRGPVLKGLAGHFLARTGAVLAFASAREVDGGSGAILVLLDEPAQARAQRRAR